MAKKIDARQDLIAAIEGSLPHADGGHCPRKKHTYSLGDAKGINILFSFVRIQY